MTTDIIVTAKATALDQSCPRLRTNDDRRVQARKIIISGPVSGRLDRIDADAREGGCRPA
jgi:hypothetical protein